MAGRNLFAEPQTQELATGGRNLFASSEPALAEEVLPITGDKTEEGLIGDQLKKQDGGLGEALLSIGSSVLAEPIAGISGIVSGVFGGSQSATDTVRMVQDALTFDPRSEAGKEKLKNIGELVGKGVDIVRKPLSGLGGLGTLATGGTLEEAAQTVSEVQERGVSTVLGEATLEATGSPELATIAHTLPTAALELLGVKGLKGAKLKGQKLSPSVSKAITQAAPDLKVIKQRASDAYKALDESGIRVKPKVFDNFVDGLQKKLAKEGIDKTLTPKSQAVIERFISEKGIPKTPSDLETLRKVASNASRSIDPPDARIGTIIVDELDTAIDSLSDQIGGKFREARGMAQRGFKSRDIADIIENASHTASGMENGLRIEVRKLLKNKKRRRGFSADEIQALNQIEQGTTSANVAKFLGKFGISEGQATSMLGASIGIGGGGAIGSVFGPVGAATGAVAVPALGQFAKKTAQRITLNNTKFADDLARSGKNAKRVTRAYLKHTPVKNRSVSDLTDLLLDQNLDPINIKSLPKSMTPANKLISDAVFFAEEIKRRAKQAGSAALIASPTLQEQQ